MRPKALPPGRRSGPARPLAVGETASWRLHLWPKRPYSILARVTSPIVYVEHNVLPGTPATEAPMAGRSRGVPLAVLRQAIERWVEKTSLRQAARETGMSPTGLRKVLSGSRV